MNSPHVVRSYVLARGTGEPFSVRRGLKYFRRSSLALFARGGKGGAQVSGGMIHRGFARAKKGAQSSEGIIQFSGPTC